MLCHDRPDFTHYFYRSNEILTVFLARFHHQPTWQKWSTRNLITKGACPSLLDVWVFFLLFFLWLNPYLHRSPSGLLAPDATARLFSDWAIWAALCWSSIESKYSVISCWDCSFLNVQTPETWTHIQTDGTDKWKTGFLGMSACTSPSWKKRGQCYAKSLMLHR